MTSTIPPTGLDPRDFSRWIESDALLRDEAVLFGWAGDDEITAKTEAIESYYEQRIQAAKREEERLDAHETVIKGRIADLVRQIEQSTIQQDADTAKLQDAHRARGDTHDLLRYGIGFFLAVLICGFNYVVVYELLASGGEVASSNAAASSLAMANNTAASVAPSPFLSTWLVALGVTLLGMFTLFAPISILYRREGGPGEGAATQPESGKVWVAELLPALAAAFFTAVWGGEPSLLHTVASFFFVSTLFLFAGKLLLSLLPRLTASYKQWRALQDLKAVVEAGRKAHQGLLAERDTQLRAFFEVQDSRRKLPSDAELRQACSRKVRLFSSEVQFARLASHRITAPRMADEVLADAR